MDGIKNVKEDFLKDFMSILGNFSNIIPYGIQKSVVNILGYLGVLDKVVVFVDVRIVFLWICNFDSIGVLFIKNSDKIDSKVSIRISKDILFFSGVLNIFKVIKSEEVIREGTYHSIFMV